MFVNNYIDENYKEDNNEYTGIFKDKNFIFVMMESMDDWLVNEEVTPTMYMMMQHGLTLIIIILRDMLLVILLILNLLLILVCIQ